MTDCELTLGLLNPSCMLQLITPCSCNFWLPEGLAQPRRCQIEGLQQLFRPTLNNVANYKLLKVHINR